MFSIHLPTLDRPEGGKAWKLLHATMAEVLSKLSARPFFPGGTLPSGPLMPALPLCTIASIIRHEWVAFSHIMPCLLVLVASIGALVLVAAVLSKFGSGSKAVSFRPSKCFPVCTSKQTQGVHERRTARTPQWILEQHRVVAGGKTVLSRCVNDMCADLYKEVIRLVDIGTFSRPKTVVM
jgi:hypothetical protein